MIEVMEDVPANVAAFRVTGKVDKEDYKDILIPAVEYLLKKQDRINFLLVLDNSLKDFTLGALLQDLGLGFKHFTKWHKMAIVSASTGINTFTDLFSYVAPGEAKGFTHEELNEAITWVSS